MKQSQAYADIHGKFSELLFELERLIQNETPDPVAQRKLREWGRDEIVRIIREELMKP